jgi:hypothetical protein
MTTTEQRLRAATQAAAQTVADDSAPPLRLTASAPRTTTPRRTMARWAAPLAAAAAVFSLVALAVTVRGRSAPTPTPTPATMPTLVQNKNLLTDVPRYYLALTALSGSGTPLLDAVIHNTLTGKTVATITAPAPFRTFTAVSGAADDRTFVLAAQPRSWPIVDDPTTFFRARFNPVTGKVTLTRLPIPGLSSSTTLCALALSPDGARLAVAAQAGRGAATAEVLVYSLQTGTVTTWQNPGTIGYRNPDYLALSWGAAGTLAVNWVGEQPQDGLRLLDTGTAGGSLLADSRLVVSEYHPQSYTFTWDAIISPDGQTIIAPEWRSLRPGMPGIGAEFQEFSAATGRLTGVLWPAHSPDETVLWSNSDGSVLLVEAQPPSGKDSATKTVFCVLSGDQFIPLPGAPAVAGSYPSPVF